MVSLDIEMTNGTDKDTQIGSWNFPFLVVGQHQFDLDAGGYFGTADAAFVKPGLTGDARAGFVVTCPPAGAIVLHLQDGQEQVSDDAITVTRTTTPAEC